MPEANHITCVCPTTWERRHVLPWAVRWFAAQVGVEADLLVVGDGPRSVSEVLPADERVRYRHIAPRKLPLGLKYNEAVRLARGPYVALWADDDWQAPWKLDELLRLLKGREGALIAGYRSMRFLRVGHARSWVYDRPGPTHEPYFLGGSLLFHKDYWRHVRRFDERAKRAADAHFTNSLCRSEYAELAAVATRAQALRGYVATIHTRNTGRGDADPSGPGWSPTPEAEVSDLLGADYAFYQDGGAVCEALRR